MTPQAKARRAAVLGFPVSHSLSPRLHKYWLKQYGIEGYYDPIEVKPENLERTLRGLAPRNFSGVNITIPYKEKALALVDGANEIARRIGAVNTITIKNGKLSGTNTDAYGFIANLKAQMPEYPAEKNVLMLGAGGAARAACVGLIDDGWKVTLAGRTRTKAEVIAKSLGEAIQVIAWEEVQAGMAHTSLLVNTTPLGMKAQPLLDISLDRLLPSAWVYDIVYNPLKTNLLMKAEARGNRVIEGLGMLIYQAQPAFESWFGIRPEVTKELYQHMREGLA